MCLFGESILIIRDCSSVVPSVGELTAPPVLIIEQNYFIKISQMRSILRTFRNNNSSQEKMKETSIVKTIEKPDANIEEPVEEKQKKNPYEVDSNDYVVDDNDINRIKTIFEQIKTRLIAIKNWFEIKHLLIHRDENTNIVTFNVYPKNQMSFMMQMYNNQVSGDAVPFIIADSQFVIKYFNKLTVQEKYEFASVITRTFPDYNDGIFKFKNYSGKNMINVVMMDIVQQYSELIQQNIDELNQYAREIKNNKIEKHGGHGGPEIVYNDSPILI